MTISGNYELASSSISGQREALLKIAAKTVVRHRPLLFLDWH